jgi:double-stranded uracil-DNA glycosylase
VLPDVLAAGLDVVFCGSAVGTRSALAGAYYAGPGNRFWEMLFCTGLTDRQLNPGEYREVLRYGIGLTDVVKRRAGNDDQLRAEDFDPVGLRLKIEPLQPGILAFNGKRAAGSLLGMGMAYGEQGIKIGQTRIWILPSTSGAARRYWDEKIWEGLGEEVCHLRKRGPGPGS